MKAQTACTVASKSHWDRTLNAPQHAHLVVPSNQVHTLGVLDLEGQQQTNCLQTVGSPVHIVSKEEVVDVGDVPSCGWCAVLLKQSHEVPKLPMQVSEDLDWGCAHTARGVHYCKMCSCFAN